MNNIVIEIQATMKLQIINAHLEYIQDIVTKVVSIRFLPSQVRDPCASENNILNDVAYY